MNPQEMAELLIHRFTFTEKMYNSDIAKRKIAIACTYSVCQLMIQEFGKVKRIGQVGYWQQVEKEIDEISKI